MLLWGFWVNWQKADLIWQQHFVCSSKPLFQFSNPPKRFHVFVYLICSTICFFLPPPVEEHPKQHLDSFVPKPICVYFQCPHLAVLIFPQTHTHTNILFYPFFFCLTVPAHWVWKGDFKEIVILGQQSLHNICQTWHTVKQAWTTCKNIRMVENKGKCWTAQR